VRRSGALLALAIAGCSAESNHELSGLGQAITSGAPAPDDDVVVALVPRPFVCGEAPPTSAACSATLVSDRAVLTAGHCVTGDQVVDVELTRRVGAADALHRRIVRVVMHPEYTRESSDHDLAIAWLDSPVATAPAQLVGANQLLAEGALVRAVGFGQTRDPGVPEGERRQGTLAVKSVQSFTFELAPSPALTCLGDSGGAIFAMFPGGERLVGVTSAGDPACAVRTVAARVDRALEGFILPTLAAGPGEPGGGLSCKGTCTSDNDCGGGLVCREARDGANRCAVSGLEPGEMGAACSSIEACEQTATACVADGDACRCYVPCGGADEVVPDTPGVDPKHPLALSRQPSPRVELAGGCAASGVPAHRGGALALVVLACGIALRRRAGGRGAGVGGGAVLTT
jgi:hypothetical protein